MKGLNLKQCLNKSIQENLKHLVDNEGRVVLGVSGGADSVFLLHMLIEILPKNDIIIAHMDHSLRPDSKNDLLFVQELCRQKDLVFYSKTVDISRIAKNRKENVEKCARDERYIFFQEVLNKSDANFIMTAHHQDDLAETILLNIFRGSSIHGLSGMSMIDGNLLRPLLNISRKQIVQYCEEENLKWVTDMTNADTSYSRNFIRFEIMPKIFERFPFAADRIHNLSKYADELSKDLENIARNFLGTCHDKIEIEKFKKLSNYLQKEVLIVLYFNLYGNKVDISTSWLDEIVDFVSNSKNGSLKEFGDSYMLSKDYHEINVISALNKDMHGEDSVLIKIPGVTIFNEYTITSDVYEPKVDFNETNCYFCYLDLELTGYDIRVRRWQKGDRFHPLNANGSKKLQDLFTDLKIPKRKRETIPVFTNSKNDIIWVGGCRIDDRYKVTNQTNSCLKLIINETV